jgi:hypothetical protein
MKCLLNDSLQFLSKEASVFQKKMMCVCGKDSYPEDKEKYIMIRAVFKHVSSVIEETSIVQDRIQRFK